MEIAQEVSQIGNRIRDRPNLVTVRALEGLAGVDVLEFETTRDGGASCRTAAEEKAESGTYQQLAPARLNSIHVPDHIALRTEYQKRSG